MFPFGGYVINTVVSRPTANTINSGSVTNPANAYDANQTSAATSSGNVSWSVQGWPIVAKTGVLVSIVYAYSGAANGSSCSILIQLSVDSGATYPYTLVTNSASIGGTMEGSGTASVTLPGLVAVGNLKVLTTVIVIGAATCDVSIYDVNALYV